MIRSLIVLMLLSTPTLAAQDEGYREVHIKSVLKIVQQALRNPKHKLFGIACSEKICGIYITKDE